MIGDGVGDACAYGDGGICVLGFDALVDELPDTFGDM